MTSVTALDIFLGRRNHTIQPTTLPTHWCCSRIPGIKHLPGTRQPPVVIRKELCQLLVWLLNEQQGNCIPTRWFIDLSNYIKTINIFYSKFLSLTQMSLGHLKTQLLNGLFFKCSWCFSISFAYNIVCNYKNIFEIY